MAPSSTPSRLRTFLLRGSNFCSTNEHYFELIAFVVADALDGDVVAVALDGDVVAVALDGDVAAVAVVV